MISPTYYLWHPKVDLLNFEKIILSFSVTSLSIPYFPDRPSAFFQQISKDLGVEGLVLSWKIMPYRSKYHGETGNEENWKNIWKLNWRVKIEMSPAFIPESFEEEYYETEALSAVESQIGEKIHANIITDFNNKASRNKAKLEVQSLFTNLNNKENVEIFFEEVDICEQFFQLQIIVGPYEDTYFLEGENLPTKIIERCKNLGGIINFDDRVNEWDEC